MVSIRTTLNKDAVCHSITCSVKNERPAVDFTVRSVIGAVCKLQILFVGDLISAQKHECGVNKRRWITTNNNCTYTLVGCRFL